MLHKGHFLENIMAEVYSILRLEFSNMNEFQKSLHGIGKDNSDDAEIDCLHTFDERFFSWASSDLIKCQSTMSFDEISYSVSKRYDYVCGSKLRVLLPNIQVKKEHEDKIEICWPNSPGLTIVRSAQMLLSDDTIISTHTTNTLMHLAANFIPDTEKELYNRMCGNMPFLTSWSKMLPKFVFYTPHIWSFRSKSQSYPIFLAKKQDLLFKYTFRLEIKDFLRMRVRVGDSWKEISVNTKFLDGIPSDERLPVPELHLNLSVVSEDEKNWISKKKYYMLIDDFVEIPAENVNKFGETAHLELKCEVPAKSLMWSAMNNTALNNRNFGNYSTNSENYMEGWDPIKDYRLMYGGASRCKKRERQVCGDCSSWDKFPGSTEMPGYFRLSFCDNPGAISPNNTVILSKVQGALYCSLGDTDPFNKAGITDYAEITYESSITDVGSMAHETSGNSDHYTLIAVVQTVKKLIFEDDICRVEYYD